MDLGHHHCRCGSVWSLPVGAHERQEPGLRQPIIDTSTVPEWAKVLAFVVVVCAAIIWLAG